ncbi:MULTISPECIES: ATP-binding protein [Fusobacterium]|uniref:sensor histidine kinase n=1 Tax=Fusobacterium TaxID=848 RepID=UPI000C70EDF6|nr:MULTISPECIES: ATP-binding protein [Fusobacterium]
MKKVFYKIFLTLLICSYLPLMGLFVLQYWYTGNYVERLKTEGLIQTVENAKIENLKKGNIYDSRKHIYLSYINTEKSGKKNIYFNIFNKIEDKNSISEIAVGDFKIVKLKLSSITNHIYMLKRISENEAIAGVVEVIKPDIMTGLSLQIYKGYSIFAIPLIFILAFILSKKFSEPIEMLELLSTNIANYNFTNNIQIKSKNELYRLAENLNKMSENLKKNIVQLNEMNEKLKSELAEKQRVLDGKILFMRAIGHELKTPIAIINGYIEALQDGIIPQDEIEKTYSIIYNEGITMDRIVQNINTFLKTEDKTVDLIPEHLNLKCAIEENLNKYKLDIAQKNIDLKCELEDLEIDIDRKALHTILNNLFTNAITYVDDNKKLEVILKDGELQVANSSKELSEQILKNLFDPFYKGDDSRQRKYGGTGLGLSIVKNLLEVLKLDYSFTYDQNRKYAVFKIKFK